MSETLLIAAGAFLALATLAALLIPAIGAARHRKARLHDLIEPDTRKRRKPKRAAPNAGSPLSTRRRSIEETLREMEALQKARLSRSRNPSLLIRMRQAGILWSKTTYLLVCLGTGVIALPLNIIFLGLPPLAAAGFALATGRALPHLFINIRRKRRLKAFDNDYPNAIDVIVRGLRSGLPLTDCLRMIASQAREPLRTEFHTVVDDQTLGVPLPEAIGRLAERVPLTEVNFFAIVVTIQAKTGGSLAEALANLSNTLRERRKMAAKIRAMSQEAKSSAAIIGALPFLVSLALYVLSPDYIALLFTTSAGNLVLAVSGVWMFIGIMVMRKMIRFNF